MARISGLWLAVAALALPTAAQADDQFKLLVFATPSKYHFEYIPVAREGLERLARLHSFGMTFVTGPEAFDGDLRQYAAIMFLNSPPEQLSEAERRRFEDYMRAGGNAVIVHRAAIVPPDAWPWYEKLVGRRFVNHPMLQTGVVRVVDRRFPATFGLPDRWLWSDEFYVTENPYKVAIDTVLTVDETSYDPLRIWPGQVGHRMGPDHPEAWHHGYERGRVFVTLLGHNPDMYRDATYLNHLLGGITWAATGLGEAKEASPAPAK